MNPKHSEKSREQIVGVLQDRPQAYSSPKEQDGSHGGRKHLEHVGSEGVAEDPDDAYEDEEINR